jgi:hypothetical protein
VGKAEQRAGESRGKARERAEDKTEQRAMYGTGHLVEERSEGIVWGKERVYSAKQMEAGGRR